MRNFEDGDSTSWRTPCETQHRFHGISAGFACPDHGGTCCTPGLSHTNTGLSLGVRIAWPYGDILLLGGATVDSFFFPLKGVTNLPLSHEAGWLASNCACPTRVFRDRALHEHRKPSSLPSHAPSKLACFSSLGMAPVLVPLRQSSEVTDDPSKLARFSSRGSSQTVLHCAHRTSTISSCAFCEQEG